MATRNTTKAKPKTTKSKAAKVTRTTKTTSVSAAKSVKTAAVSAPRNNKKVDMLGIRRLLLIASGLYAVLAVAAATLMNNFSQEVTVGYLTRDTLASKAATVFAPATRVLYDLELKWALVALMLLSLILPILYLTRWERKYADALRGRVIPWRWIDIAISGALMIEIVALLNGIQDLMAIKLMVGLVALGAFLSWVAERQNENANRPVLTAYTAALVSWALPFLAILIYALGTPFYGMVRSPWYVYALDIVVFAGIVLFARNQYKQHRRVGVLSDYMTVERNYLRINVLTKVAFALVLIVGLQR